VYLCIFFTACGGSCSDSTLAGQALKAILKLIKYLFKFTALSIKHKLELFDKLVVPILNCGSEVWGFHNGNAIERIHVHMQLCKRLLGVKKCTQNDLVYGDLVRCPMRNCRMYNIVKYWTKIKTM